MGQQRILYTDTDALEQLGAAASNRALALVVRVEKRFEASSASPNKLRGRMRKGTKRSIRDCAHYLHLNQFSRTSRAQPQPLGVYCLYCKTGCCPDKTEKPMALSTSTSYAGHALHESHVEFQASMRETFMQGIYLAGLGDARQPFPFRDDIPMTK
jgi:hypothetical protein